MLSPYFYSERNSLKFNGRRMNAGWAGKAVCYGDSYKDMEKLVTDLNYRKECAKYNRSYSEKHYNLDIIIIDWAKIISNK